MNYDSLEYLILDREYKAYMQGLNQEPKYNAVPNGYKVCDECGTSVHKVGYSVCFHCFGKKHPDLYEKHARNFQASIDHENISLRQGGGDEDRPEKDNNKPSSLSPVPDPIDYD